MKRELDPENQVDYFALLPDDLKGLVLSAMGHDIFAWCCVSRDLRDFIATQRVMEHIPALRFFYHQGYPMIRQRDLPAGQRLVALQPRVLNVNNWTVSLDPNLLAACGGSLTALSLYQFQAITRPDELFTTALGQLTRLVHLEINDCHFTRSCEDELPSLCASLACLTRLETLVVGGEDAFDMRCLSALGALRWLDVEMYALPTFDDVSHLQCLETLGMVRMTDAQDSRWCQMTQLRTLMIDTMDEEELTGHLSVIDDMRADELAFLPKWITPVCGHKRPPVNRCDTSTYYWYEESKRSRDSSDESGISEEYDSEDDDSRRICYGCDDLFCHCHSVDEDTVD